MLTTYKGYMAVVKSSLFAEKHGDDFPGYSGFDGSPVIDTFAVSAERATEKWGEVLAKLREQLGVQSMPHSVVAVTVVITESKPPDVTFRQHPEYPDVSIPIVASNTSCLCCGQPLPKRADSP